MQNTADPQSRSKDPRYCFCSSSFSSPPSSSLCASPTVSRPFAHRMKQKKPTVVAPKAVLQALVLLLFTEKDNPECVCDLSYLVAVAS